MIITLPRQSSVDTIFDLNGKYMVLYEGDNFIEFDNLIPRPANIKGLSDLFIRFLICVIDFR